jgi:hypothetical protein
MGFLGFFMKHSIGFLKSSRNLSNVDVDLQTLVKTLNCIPGVSTFGGSCSGHIMPFATNTGTYSRDISPPLFRILPRGYIGVLTIPDRAPAKELIEILTDHHLNDLVTTLEVVEENPRFKLTKYGPNINLREYSIGQTLSREPVVLLHFGIGDPQAGVQIGREGDPDFDIAKALYSHRVDSWKSITEKVIRYAQKKNFTTPNYSGSEFFPFS